MLLRLGRIVVIAALLLAGIWLVARASGPAPEGLARVQAVQMAAAGARVGSAPEGQLPEVTVAEPVTVDLSQVPSGVYDPNNQFDRWQRGEIDLLENEDLRPPADMAALREAAEQLPPSPNISLAAAAAGPSPNAPAPGVSFDSLSFTECCGGGGNVPPDPELAVGPNHAIAVVNVAFEIYDKNGTTLKPPTTFASFMSANPNCTGVFDPNVLYDESADRYFLGIDADGSYYCAAVSQTGNPLGGWNIYAFQTATGNLFFDYPHVGVGRDAIYMGANMFVSAFQDSRIWAFDKTAMYNGQPTTAVMKILPNTEDTPQPLNLHGFQQGTWPASGPHYFFTDFNFNGSTYSVWSWANPFSGGNPTKVGTVNINAFTGVTAGMPVNVPQNGSGLIQANDFRPQDFEYRNGFAWSVMTIACNPGGGTVDCIQWVKINPATATIVDAGVYSSAGQYRFFGDLAVNHCDDMAVGYTKSSTSMFPSIWYTGRKAGDPAGTLQAEAQLKAGDIAYTAFDPSPRRWGDYTEMTIAPDGTTFWYLGEYSKNTGTTSGRWGTWIGSFTFADCTTGGPTPTPTATPPPGSNVHVGDLDASATTSGRSWTANVTVTVHNNSEAPVANATVSGNWSNGTTGSGSCVTNASGQCVISKSGLGNSLSSVTFTVSNVAVGGQNYAAGDNHDPDGDSNGTSIVVNKSGTPPTPTPTATPGPGGSMHVGDLDGSGTLNGNRWNASVTITVHDSSHAPVSGATVSGSWSAGTSGSASCATNASGQCTVTKTNLRSNVNSVTFSVSNVTKAGSTYGSGANHDPESDSTGTVIIVAKP